MELIDKEVYYDFYCPRCVYANNDEAIYPCDECLGYPSNAYSHKPVYYQPARGHEKDIHPQTRNN